MAAQAGAAIVIYVNAGTDQTPDFQPIAGMRSKGFTINNNPIDITNSDSPGRFREILGTAALRQASMTGSGVFIGDANDQVMVDQALAGVELKTYRFLIPTFGTLEGLFFLSSFSFTGNHDGDATHTMNWENAGPFAITYA